MGVVVVVAVVVVVRFWLFKYFRNELTEIGHYISEFQGCHSTFGNELGNSERSVDICGRGCVCEIPPRRFTS